jgi:hypothetical protein
MTKVLIKHKDGSLSGPYECDADGYINLKEQYTTIRSGFLKSLGLEVIPYEERKVEITKKRLAEAWDKVGALTKSSCSGTFRELCEELGLGE